MKKHIIREIKLIIAAIVKIVIIIAILSAILNYSETCRNFLNFGIINFNIPSVDEQDIYAVEIISQNNTFTVNIFALIGSDNYTVTKTHIETISIFLIVGRIIIFILDIIAIFIYYLLIQKDKKFIEKHANPETFEKDNIRIPNYNPLILYELKRSERTLETKEIIDILISYLVIKGHISEDEEKYITQNTSLENLSKIETVFMQLFFQDSNYINKNSINYFDLEEHMKELFDAAEQEAIELGFFKAAKRTNLLKDIKEKIINSTFYKKYCLKYCPDSEEAALLMYWIFICAIILVIVLILGENIAYLGLIPIVGLIYFCKNYMRTITTKGKLEKIKNKILTKKLGEQEVLNELEELYYRMLKHLYFILK